jgi:glycosyltransferase involved in cell wall biosynthesis
MTAYDKPFSQLRVAIVHPWYLAHGGAEQTVDALAQAFPAADFFTLLYNEKDLPKNLRGRNITALKMNWIPAKYKLYRFLLPFYPLMIESLDLTGYDLILSSDSCVIKGVLIDQNAVHICYCHSPMRCLWDLRHQFATSFIKPVRSIFTLGTHYVRQWDFTAAQRVDKFVANSYNVAQRIVKFYRRESTVVYPPVGTASAYVSPDHDDYYLSVGRLTDVKRIDVLIRACNRLGRRLVIAGTGRELDRLKGMAGPTIEFVGRVPDAELRRLYARCRAFLFAADEDFGIVPVEAQAYGRPVVAYGRGGALETVRPMMAGAESDATGVFFAEQTEESAAEAILEFEQIEHLFRPDRIQSHARRFDTRVFCAKMRGIAEEAIESSRLFKTAAPPPPAHVVDEVSDRYSLPKTLTASK